MAFASALLRSGRAGSPVVGLVPSTVGGTRMAEWGKGTECYADMLHRARVAVETEGRIGALLWYQVRGERHRTEYRRWMGLLVRDLLTDLSIPHLLVIQEAHSANGDSVQEG